MAVGAPRRAGSHRNGTDAPLSADARGSFATLAGREAHMSPKATKRLVREGDFVAEVDVHLIESDGGWAPYLSLDDAY